MKIEVLGTAFVVQSDQDPAYLREIIDFFKSRVRDIENTVSTKDPLKISILASILVIDEFLKYKTGQAPGNSIEALEAASIAQRLIRDLDKMLDPLE